MANFSNRKNVHHPTDLRREVIKKDPTWSRDKDFQAEYKFATPSGERVFEANVSKRGAYRPET